MRLRTVVDRILVAPAGSALTQQVIDLLRRRYDHLEVRKAGEYLEHEGRRHFVIVLASGFKRMVFPHE
jgi:hypothetical protein